MLTMSQINHIKDLSNCGYRISEISEKTGADPKTIRKYLAQDDFSPEPPVILSKPFKLDPFKPWIYIIKVYKIGNYAYNKLDTKKEASTCPQTNAVQGMTKTSNELSSTFIKT